MRLHTVTEKVDREETGLVTSLYVHVDFDDDGRAVSVDFSTYGKLGNTQIADALKGIGKKINGILATD